MSELSAEQLHEIVGPVWTKHPGTRPSELRRGRVMERGPWRWRWKKHWIDGDAAALLCEAQMTRWLAETRELSVFHSKQVGDWLVWLDGEQAISAGRPTLLEALAAACLAVAQ